MKVDSRRIPLFATLLHCGVYIGAWFEQHRIGSSFPDHAAKLCCNFRYSRTSQNPAK